MIKILLQSARVCTPPSSFLLGVLNLLPNFEKGGGGLGRTFIFNGMLVGKSGETFSREGGCNFYIKDKLKSEIFNDQKKVYKQKCFSPSFMTKNSNWETVTKNLVIIKNKMVLRMKNLNILGVHWKIRFLGGVHKKKYRGGNCLKTWDILQM